MKTRILLTIIFAVVQWGTVAFAEPKPYDEGEWIFLGQDEDLEVKVYIDRIVVKDMLIPGEYIFIFRIVAKESFQENIAVYNAKTKRAYLTAMCIFSIEGKFLYMQMNQKILAKASPFYFRPKNNSANMVLGYVKKAITQKGRK